MHPAALIWFGVMLFIGGMAVLTGGLREIGRGLRAPDDPDAPIWLCRGLRDVLLVICGVVIGLGAWFDSKAAMMVGGIILAEELYETGIALLILERGRAARGVSDAPA